MRASVGGVGWDVSRGPGDVRSGVLDRLRRQSGVVADVVISYHPERRAAAQHLATVLRHYGYSVWFDNGAAGAGYGGQVAYELQSAPVTVVLWCSLSREASAVIEQATLAQSLNRLVPAWLERIDPPMGFSLTDTIDLSVWDGAPRSPGLQRLLAEVERRVGQPPQPDGPALEEYERTWRMFGAPSLARFELMSAPAYPAMPPGGYSPAGGYPAPAGTPGGGYPTPTGTPVGAYPAPTGTPAMGFSRPGEGARGAPFRAEAPVRSGSSSRLIVVLAALGGAAIMAGIAAVALRSMKSTGVGAMVSVPAGPFMWGCNKAIDTECDSDDRPFIERSVDAFSIDKTEVTVAAYRACVEAGACSSDAVTTATGKYPMFCNWGTGRDDHPMNCVTWAESDAYCRWAGKRLPTEVEWEKAARGTEGIKYSWGNTGFLSKVANVADEAAKAQYPGWTIPPGYDDGYIGTSPVGAYPAGASPYGALDMIGNVEEWTAEPLAGGVKRCLRGGSWFDPPKFVRTSARYIVRSSERRSTVGFRCAK